MLASSAEGIQLHSCGSHTDAHTHRYSKLLKCAVSSVGSPGSLDVTDPLLSYSFTPTLPHTRTQVWHTHTHTDTAASLFDHLPISLTKVTVCFSLFSQLLPPPHPSLLLFSHPSPGLMNFTTWRLPVSGRGKKGGVGGAKERDSERIKFCWCLVNGSEVSGMASDLCCMDTLFKDQ